MIAGTSSPLPWKGSLVHIFWHGRPVCRFADWPLAAGHTWVSIGTPDEADATCQGCIDGVREERGAWAGDMPEVAP